MALETGKEKRALRREVLARRAAMTEAERHRASAAIQERLFATPQFAEARGVHCFVSLPDEVETGPIFERCWNEGKRTFIPYQQPGQKKLGWALRKPEDTLVQGPFNVMEPPPETRGAMEPTEIDLVVVPGVAFDPEGNRLGYGKGFYDLFLADLVSHARKGVLLPRAGLPAMAAVAFASQMVAAVPRDPWDIRIKMILTELETMIV